MKKKVLIIEDNDDIRESTAEILELAGYETFIAKQGRVGVDLAIQYVPDIVLCDIMMPELDGYGVLYLLHKNPKTAAIPFIFITAKTARADMRRGMEMGADDYLTKPFDDVELFKAIESRFRKKQQLTCLNTALSTGENTLHQLCEKGKARSIGGKQIIYVEGDEPTHVYYLNNGHVKTYKRFKDGRELSCGLYGAGEFFGYESLCGDTLNFDNAATLVDSEITLISKQDFMECLLNQQTLSKILINLLSESSRYKKEQMLHLAYSSVRKRVAEALLQVAEKFGELQTDTCTVRISRDDLASLVGTAGETISRMLADFKSEKLIDKTGNAINILSLERLTNIRQ